MRSPGGDGSRPPSKKARRERRTAIALFLVTLASVYLVFGYQWMGGDPLSDREVAWGSAKFAGGLMGILLAHEMAHYLVALRHGFRLSLPYFIPFPAAFGTFGAIIRLRSLPTSRTALLEMGAAGPLAGFAVALVAIVLGLPGTVESALPELVMTWPPPEVVPDPSDAPGALTAMLIWLIEHPPLSWLVPPVEPGTVPLMILANPPIMDVLGFLVLGEAPGRYATLDPLATAGWVGCLLTAINLVPIGQLDGGHVCNALFPHHAERISRLMLGVVFLSGFAWSGWTFWAVLLLLMRAHHSLPVPTEDRLSIRARRIAMATALAFVASFMPTPVEVESRPLSELVVRTPEGRRIPVEEVEVWMDQVRAQEAVADPRQ